MKKKRVSKPASKKTTKPPASSRGDATASSKVSKSLSSSAKSKKVNNSKNPSRSSRITKALKQIAPISKKAAVSVEPLSTAVPMPVEMITDLPFSFGETKLVLMVRDPFWAYTYWDFSIETWNWIVAFRERDPSVKPKLRIHNVDRGTSFDMDIYLDARNWYVDLGLADTTFELELGLLDSHGKFHRIALSNRMKTPRSGPSENIDPQWQLSDFEASEIYRLSGGGKAGYGSEIFSSIRRR